MTFRQNATCFCVKFMEIFRRTGNSRQDASPSSPPDPASGPIFSGDSLPMFLCESLADFLLFFLSDILPFALSMFHPACGYILPGFHLSCVPAFSFCRCHKCQQQLSHPHRQHQTGLFQHFLCLDLYCRLGPLRNSTWRIW